MANKRDYNKKLSSYPVDILQLLNLELTESDEILKITRNMFMFTNKGIVYKCVYKCLQVDTVVSLAVFLHIRFKNSLCGVCSLLFFIVFGLLVLCATHSQKLSFAQ